MDHKAAMKQLREERQGSIKAAAAKAKEQRRDLSAIRETLGDGALTVPEIAAGCGLPAANVLWYVASMKKYGDVLEDEKDGAYFRYRLAPATSGAPKEDGNGSDQS